MQVKTSDLMRFLLKDVLGAINFDNIPKWEVEDEVIPKTFFNDRLKNNPNNPINQEVVGRIIKIYQAQLGIYKMKEPISDALSCSYADKVLERIAKWTGADVSALKNQPSHTNKNIERRQKLIDILYILLNASIGNEVIEGNELKDEIESVATTIELHIVSSNEVSLPEKIQQLHLVQQKGKCPVCNSQIISQAGDTVSLSYHIIKINESGSVTADNTVAICENCFAKYEAGIKPSKATLSKLKAQMKLDAMYADNVDTLNIDKEIEAVLEALQTTKPTELVKLKYEPVKVEKKINEDFLLCDKVKGFVVRYFNFVGDKLKQLNAENKLKYEIISNEVKMAYLTFASMQGLDANGIFDKMVEWLMDKTECNNKTACEIVIAYYVQNCEVFSETTE